MNRTDPVSLSKRLGAAGLIVAATLAGTPLMAQVYEKEVQKPATTEEAQKEAAKAAAEAKKLEAEGGGVTYDQVLADPDNIDLNYRYALTQVRKGDLKGASATLERILLINPNLPKVRLFHAIVLYRLDSLAESRAQFETLKSQPIPDNIRSEADGYLRLISKREKHTQLSGRLGVGFEYDNNRNSSPASGLRLFLGTPLALDNKGQRQQDTSELFLANVEAHHDLGTQAGHEIFGSFNYYRAEQTVVKSLNLQAYSLAGGAIYKTPSADFTPVLNFDYILLAQSTFLRQRGYGLRVDHRISKRTGIYAELKDNYQTYVNTEQVTTASQRSGIQLDFTGGVSCLLAPTMKLEGGYHHIAKHAYRGFFAYDGDALFANHSWLLGRGMFLVSSLNIEYDQYHDPDFAVSATYRRDKTLRANATFGTPLTFVNPALSDLIWTLTYEYYDAFSTVTNYSYSNNKIATLLTYKWGLGL